MIKQRLCGNARTKAFDKSKYFFTSRIFKITAIISLTALLCAGCGGNGGGILQKKDWNQFHADGPSTGFQPVRSEQAFRPKWTFDVGKARYCSPVLGPDGTIYLGTTDGYMVAINPNGTQKWRRWLGAGVFDRISIMASPAASDDGFLYVIVNQERGGGRLNSRLLSLQQGDGGTVWTYQFPRNGYTLSSPKIWKNTINGWWNIFVYVHQDSLDSDDIQVEKLYAFDHLGEMRASKTVGEVCVPPSDDCNLWCFLKNVWDFLASLPVEFDESGIAYPFIDPTPAIVDSETLTLRGTALITVVDNFCHTAVYRWDPPWSLDELWLKEHDFNEGHSSPLVISNGMMVVGQEGGYVVAYDVLTGDELWKYDTGGDAIYGSPASFGRQIFVTSNTKIYVLDYNGTLVKKKSLAGWTAASPALSSDFIYVANRSELETFAFTLDTLDPTYHATLQGGNSSPAIAKDGTIYVLTWGGELRAYGGKTYPRLSETVPLEYSNN